MDIARSNTQQENEHRVAEEYLSSLSDLNCNSKPLINMLTMLAEENIEYAPVIVKVVEQHIAKVPPEFKLPILYLIDSIVKNVKSTYVQLFSQCIVNIFCGVFEKVNEKIRERMYVLRQTWNEVFAAQKLYALDVKVKRLDNNWPITAKQPSIHVNPNFLKVNAAQAIPTEMEKILQDKTRELLELKKRKLELELEATKKHLEEQEKQFSKTTESVMPPVEALVAANSLQNVGIRGPPMPPQMMTAMIPPNYMGGPSNIAVNPAMRPAMFHHNMRAFRPNLHPNMMNNPPQVMSAPNMHPVGVAPNANKPKVHPVNSLLLNSVRQRDPRLQRQQQQQQQQQNQNGERSSGQQNFRSSQNDKDNHDRNHKNSHKSPTRVSSSSSSRSSSSRSGKSSQKDKERERDRDRKRNEPKSSTTSSSSASNDRKKNFSIPSKTDRNSSKCDKDAFEIAPLSSAFKRKSTSPASSPSKSRESKRSNSSHKSRNSSRSKTRSRSLSRSQSPDDNKATKSYGDVDLRRISTSSTSSSIINSPDKRPKLSDSDQEASNNKEDLSKLLIANTTSNPNDKDLDKTTSVAEPVTGLKDIDLRPQFVVANSSVSTATTSNPKHDQGFNSSPTSFSSYEQNIDLSNKFTSANITKTTTNMHFLIKANDDNVLTTSAKNVATSSPKVSFKIQKIFNKLEKSTENILSATPPPSTTATITAVTETLKDTCVIKKEESSGQVSKDLEEEDGKKRSLAPIKEEEPLPKKSKSAKIDALFGSEDVDLRKLIPPAMAAANNEEELAPPPPAINMPTDSSTGSNENWDNLKIDNKNCPTKAKSSLEDVRAKLAKTAKLSKLSKLDKLTRDIDHRNKLAELQLNDDNQEANDEKIRTMITQAQELLESNSISQEQYKHLVKTVMSINETNKLKEAKRRESLNAIKQKLNDEGSNDSTGRNLAMQAVLKKRIPKLNKNQTMNSEQNTNSDSQLSESIDGNGEESSRIEEKPDSNDEPSSALQGNVRANRGNREKRGPKISKWGERVIDPASTNMPMSGPAIQSRLWNPIIGPNNKRSMPNFRGNVAQNVRPSWPMSAGTHCPPNGPPHFGKGLNIIRGNALPPGGPPQAPIIPKPCNSIDNPQEDLVRTITIDGAAKEIRFYDQVAIVFMEVDQPREIGFQNGQRSICIDNSEPVILHFNDEYKPVQIDGETINLRFGFPSRELYIDEHWYEIYFGGPAISVPIRSKMHMLKAEGPPPQVNIGPLRRDLVVGKINMIVDAHNVIPLFLDARLQTFKLGDREHTIQFADSLLTVLLDGTPTRVEYGGLPKSLFLGGKKYFVRFGALPQGVIAGKVHIKDMIYVEAKPPVKEDISETEDIPTANTTTTEINPVELQKTPAPPSVPILSASALSNVNIDELFQKLVSTGILGGASGILPTINTAPAAASQIVNKTTEIEKGVTVISSESNSTEDVAPPPPPVHVEPVKPIDLSKPDSIKTRQAAIVETLFSGMQCSSCGVRFPPEQTIKYSQHLDWHFRQNRRERDSSRKAHARKWYYDLNDWVQYEEIEDLEEREKNFFETQQNDPETMDETSNQRSANSPIPTCPAGTDDVDRACDMCQEKFEQFYDNELEEWHLRCAIRIDDKIYHPLCYEDYKASLNPPINNAKENEEENQATETSEMSLIQIDDDNAVDIVIKVEEEKDFKAALEDDDDDVIVLPNEEPSVTEIVDDDDDEYVPANVTREQMGHINENDGGQGEHNEATESDVEIQEPNIPFTDLDTYEEKEILEGDDVSQMSFMNVKIKEEPKDNDEDEDDGFEDVGTVVIAPEEISIHSSEETQTQTIESSNTALSPIPERPDSAASSKNHKEDIESLLEPLATDLNISMDGNIETGDEHNLSATGSVPTVPLASLVNKIKINITKNTVTTSSNTSSSTSVTAFSTSQSSASVAQTDSLGYTTNVVSNPIPTISTIPVLCGGGTTISSISTNNILGGGVGSGGYDDHSSMSAVGDNSVSTISVIGSYGSTTPTITHINRPIVVVPTPAPKPATPPPQPIEETITYEQKPALQKANLKKKEKVVCGNETSGLCSIM